MLDKTKVTEFFDRLAPTWDAELVPKDRLINEILDNAAVTGDLAVLDVACGTGVLFPYYLARGLRSVTGVDISPEMIKVAREKYAGEDRISLICGDVEEAVPGRLFDAVVVYNAFPHFADPARLIAALSSLTKPGGRLTIAHSMSRAQVNDHHKGSANQVSNGLMPAEELSRLFAPYYSVELVISNDEMYQVTGLRLPG